MPPRFKLDSSRPHKPHKPRAHRYCYTVDPNWQKREAKWVATVDAMRNYERTKKALTESQIISLLEEGLGLDS